MGNSVGAETAHQNLTVTSGQSLSATTEARAYVQTRGTSGESYLNAAQATGNTGHAAACCGYLSGDVKQTVNPNSEIVAWNESRVGGSVVDAAASATALGNSWGYAAKNGAVGARTEQKHYGTTHAYNHAVLCCVTGSGQFAATAVANSVTSEVENGEAIHQIVQLVDGFETRATNDVYVVTGNMIAGAATATANTAVLGNTAGYAELHASQTNHTLVDAESQVQLDTWYGVGSTTAYGVGNTIHLSNVSPDPLMRTSQLNTGDVNAWSTFRGGYGEDVVNSATAIGNSVSGVACGECHGVIDAVNRQENNGRVRATARTYAGHARHVVSSATAVGNSASYESFGGGN